MIKFIMRYYYLIYINWIICRLLRVLVFFYYVIRFGFQDIVYICYVLNV